MKCQIPFSRKNKKNISKCHLLKIFPRLLSVKRWLCCNHKKNQISSLFVFLIHILWNLYQQPFFSRLLVKTHTEEAPLTVILLQQPHPCNSLLYLFPIMTPAQSDVHRTGDQEVVGSLLVLATFSHKIDHEKFSMIILSFQPIQGGQLSVSGETMCTSSG